MDGERSFSVLRLPTRRKNPELARIFDCELFAVDRELRDPHHTFAWPLGNDSKRDGLVPREI